VCNDGYQVLNDAAAQQRLLSCPGGGTSSGCSGLIDLVFVVDSSGSIRDAGYENWDTVLQFVADVVQSLTIGPQSVQVGMVVYSNNARVDFNLNTHMSASPIVNAILSASYIGGTTNTADGINMARTQVFPTGRNGATRVMIVVTDGASNVNQGQTIPEADRAKAEGIDVVCIGVTNGVIESEVRAISSDPMIEGQNWWILRGGFTELQGIVEHITAAVSTGCAAAADNLYCRPTCCYGTICHCITSPTGIYPVNGTTCTDVDECQYENGLCEHQCVNTQGSYFCTCPNGYQLGGNNHACKDVNECDNNPCQPGYVCVNTWGAYHCLQGAFAAAMVGGVETAVASTSSVNIMGIVGALALAILNVIVLGLLAARLARKSRKHQQSAPKPATQSLSTARTADDFGTKETFHDVDLDSVSTIST